MNRILASAACAFALPGLALAATRSYSVAPFESVSVAAGITADIESGPSRSLVAESDAEDFGDLRIGVEGNVLRIDRPPRNWLFDLFSRDTHYRVHIVTPTLRSLTASSGAHVTVNGSLQDDLSIRTSSGSDVRLTHFAGGKMKAATSSGSSLELAGHCGSLEAHASSGSRLNAKDLKCEDVTVLASSGSHVAVAATKRAEGKASSGSNVLVRGSPALVRVEQSSGAGVSVRD